MKAIRKFLAREYRRQIWAWAGAFHASKKLLAGAVEFMWDFLECTVKIYDILVRGLAAFGPIIGVFALLIIYRGSFWPGLLFIPAFGWAGAVMKRMPKSEQITSDVRG